MTDKQSERVLRACVWLYIGYGFMGTKRNTINLMVDPRKINWLYCFTY